MQKIHHLVLLVGTNPLPNYVVAKYFLTREKELKKIWLVYSEKIGNQNSTRDLAENLRNVLNKITDVSIKFISLSDVSSAQKIESDIQEKLIPKFFDEYVHLNYTGGTKAMSVHVYRTLDHELGDICSFSYLDSRDYILKNDNGDITNDLRDEINISLDDLMELHGCEKVESEDNPKWLEVIDEFEKLIIKNKLKTYLEFNRNFIEKVYYDANFQFIEKVTKFKEHNNLPEKTDSLNELFKNHASDDDIMTLLRKIPSEHSIINEDGTLWLPTSKDTNKTYENRLKSSVKNFLHGKWLEIYVSEILERNIIKIGEQKSKQTYFVKNWRNIKKTSITDTPKPFEIDILIIYGYQLCGVSITTSDKQLICKSKAFEILHRIEQLGGSESKAILITCLPESRIKEFKEDLKTISGAAEDKLLVLCESDLRPDELWKNIKRHIWGNLM